MKKVVSLVAVLLVFVCSVNFCFADVAAPAAGAVTETGAVQTDAAETKTQAPAFVLKDVDTSTELGKSIKKLYDAGVVNGIPEDDGTYTYRAANHVTRAEFCKMINITFDYKVAAANIFTDVNPSQWYYIHILPAIYQGYIKGRGDGTFGGTDNITREQVCVILDRIVNKKSDKEVAITDEVSDWAKAAVVNMIGLGYMSLEEGGKFRAKENMTRGELAFALDDFAVIRTPATDNGSTGNNTTDKNEDKTDTSRLPTSGGSTGASSGGGSSGGGSTGGGSTGGGSTGGGSTGGGSTGGGSTGGDNTGGTESGGTQTPAEPSYSLSYVLDGGERGYSKETYKASDADYKLPIAWKTGYRFMGWFETEDADPSSAEAVTVLATGSTGDKTYYAKWAKEYTITYVLNPATYGETIPDESKGKFAEGETVVTKYTEYDEVVLPTPVRDDAMEFIGWYLEQEFMGNDAIVYTDDYKAESIPAGTTGNKVYHAVWLDMEIESMEIYIAIDDAVYDIEISREPDENGNTLLVLSEKAAPTMDIVYNALSGVLAWEEQGILLTNYFIRKVFTDEGDQLRGIISSFTPEERTEFENALIVGLSVNTLDNMKNIFNINMNFGKE